ncbi:MAG: outer membrane beta-barrel protein [Methylocystis sp.]
MGKRVKNALRGVALISVVAATAAQAADDSKVEPAPPSQPARPPVPLGVFGDFLPGAGNLLINVMPQFIGNAHSLIGTQGVSPQQIVATTPWYWAPVPLRVVPIRRLDELQSLTLAYGVTKDISIVLTSGLIEKHIDQMTFNGTSGIIPRGMANPGTESLQDTHLSGIWRVYQDPINRIQLNLGMSFPTGSDHNLATPFQTNGTWATGRAFYAMQTGTGTFDIMPGILYGGTLGSWSWGLSYRARLPLGVNPEGYMWGNYQEANGWLGYSWVPGFTTTFRINGNIQDHIVGADPWIVAKIQAADPLLYGGKRLELFGGASLDGKLVGVPGVSLLVEGGVPVYQNLIGPQLAKAWQATAALRWKIGDQPAPTAVPDLPSRKGSPAFAASPVGSWNGLYLGLNGGYAWNGDSATNFNYTGSGGGFVALSAAGALPTGFNLSNNGFMGGGQIGYNYRISDTLVAGVESDLEGMAVGVSAANWFAASPITYVQGVRSQHTFGTVRGRAGFLVTPTLLVFGTGGLAYGEADLSAAWFSPKLKPILNAGGTAYGYQDMRTGWTGGGGVEWMFLPKWSAKVEYLYYDLGTATTTPLQAVYGAKGLFSNASYQARFNGDVVRAGVNYHFGWGAPAPVVAKF